MEKKVFDIPIYGEIALIKRRSITGDIEVVWELDMADIGTASFGVALHNCAGADAFADEMMNAADDDDAKDAASMLLELTLQDMEEEVH
jgi:hypothetical protein